jgi:hypothetical protein
MYVDSIDDLTTLSAEELNAVVQDDDNAIEVRRKARQIWRALIERQPKAELDKTIVITPDVSRSPVDDPG